MAVLKHTLPCSQGQAARIAMEVSAEHLLLSLEFNVYRVSCRTLIGFGLVHEEIDFCQRKGLLGLTTV